MAFASDSVENLAIREARLPWRHNVQTILICLLVSTTTLQYGLDTNIINGLQAMKGFLMVFGHKNPAAPNGYGIETSFQQAITSLMNIGLATGAFTLEFFADRLGRRKSFTVASLFVIAANLILILSTNKGVIIFGRFLIGVSNGFYTGFTSIYISEAAPPHLRGSLVSFLQMSVCIGTVIGACINNATMRMESRLSYQIPLFALFLVPTLWFVIAFLIPESPRWLILKGRPDDARKHLRRLRGSSFPADFIEAEIACIEQAVEAEKDSKLRFWAAARLMFSPAERRRTLLSFAAGLFVAASGFPFMSGYKTYFFQIAGSKTPFIDSIIVSTVSLAGATAGLFCHRFMGRRPLLIFGYSVQAVLMLIIAAVWTANPGTVTTGKVIVAMVVIFQCIYSALVGPCCWIVSGEIPNNRLRATTFGFAHAIGFLGYFLISFTTPYFINPESLNIGPQVGYIWFGSNTIAAVFVYFFLPETHRRSLENLDEMFYNKVPTRKFKSYQCTGVVINPEEDEKTQAIETESKSNAAVHLEEQVTH
ncbi:hypothetical protein VTK73DRAFT_2899 [Phialemonium thermophilum]|uniref:Major facilitator superfamily (MFS) profile domain-containing protein n=1 Tax=Phialemonium thermophilum TaxID=223376 RepID=A0ABR3X274_9PEZI